MKLKTLIATLFIVLFLNACIRYPVSEQDQPKVDDILALSNAVLADPYFRAVLQAIPASKFNHKSDSDALSQDDGKAVLAKILDHPTVGVICRRAKWPFNRATNAWEGQGTPQLRCSKLGKRDDALWVGTIIHEQAHGAGYRHKGNKRLGNQCTVPHLVGDLAVYIAQKKTGSAALPQDVCLALKEAVAASQI